MRLLYTFGVQLYILAIRCASLYNPKAKKWLHGRRGLFEALKRDLSGSNGIIWFHCASLGEFEQGRPLIERIRALQPQQKILLTFYSPSGYEIRKKYDGADWVYYLPSDTPAHAALFLDIVKPAGVFIVKYEFWFNFLYEIEKRKIPAYLVSGTFRKSQLFFKWYGSWFRKRLSCFSKMYLQDENSTRLLEGIGFSNTLVCGDPRFDRVIQIASEARDIPYIPSFTAGKKVLVGGSVWREDLLILAQSCIKTQDYKLILAPHETDEMHIREVIDLFKGEWKVLRYSDANEKNISDAEVLVIDNVGMLSSLYRYGTLAFIGGGFGEGIHNILEDSVFGLPVFFGPKYKKFPEAIGLVSAGGAFCVSDLSDFDRILRKLNEDATVLMQTRSTALEYVRMQSGASLKILTDAGFEKIR